VTPDGPGRDRIGDEHVGDGSSGDDTSGGEFSGADHLGWRISALLDGELSVTEEIVARGHLERCDQCQDEFVEVTQARFFVRQLGDVEPPQDFVDKLVSSGGPRFSPRLGLAGLVALAAAWILFLAIGVGVSLPDVSPPVDEFAEQHVAVADQADADLPERSDGFRRVPMAELDDLDAPYTAPATLASDNDEGPGFDRVAAYDNDGSLQVLYSDGETRVSVFQQEGVLDWGTLPSSGDRDGAGGAAAWVGTPSVIGEGTPSVVVIDKGSVVYTVVTDAPPAAAVTVARDLPDPPSYSIGQRAQKNLEQLARRVGLGAAEVAPRRPGPDG
jgi:hypothetical protein